MTSAALVEESAKRLEMYVEADDWAKADRALQYLVGAWQRARLRGKACADVAARADALRIKLVGRHDIDQEIGPTQIAWMLAGACSFLTQAVTPDELTGEDVESRILEALAADAEPMTTSELAARIGRSVGATARALPRLRDQGLTTARSAGRSMLNGISPKGRTEAERVRSKARRRDVADAPSWPTSLRRSHEARPAPIDARDIRSEVQPNAVETLRRLRA